MRVKRQKRHRKVVRFYSACFGFREPYKIFCDGTFIHHLIDHSLTPADDTLSHLLGGRVLLFTTSCVVAELRSLGSSHAEALAAAQELVMARCEHEKRVAAPNCIEDVVGEGNAEHFFVATQDADLRKKFRKDFGFSFELTDVVLHLERVIMVPGVPLIYGLKNSLFIEQPSKHQREYVASAEEIRLHMSNSEYPRLHKRGQDSSENNMIDLSSEHDGSENVVMKTQAMQNTYAARRKLGLADKSKFKRKIAKGPNPLSCKKKKKRETPTSARNQEGGADSTTKRKRVRKRKRTPKAGKSEA